MRERCPELGLPEDRQRIYFHPGSVISMANSIDARMVQVGSYLPDPEAPNDGRAPLTSTWEAAKKRSASRNLLPTRWVQGQQLIEGIRQCVEYRNSMGHSSLVLTFGRAPDSAVDWVWRSLGKNEETIDRPVDVGKFDRWELRFCAVGQSFKFIVGPARHFVQIDGFRIDQIDMAGSLQTTPADDWSLVTENLAEQWNSAIAWPCPSSALPTG